MPSSFSSDHPAQSDPAQAQGSGDAAHAMVASPVADLVDGANALAAYHAFVEAAVYARSLKSARAARDFHGELIGRAQALLEFGADKSGLASIDAEIQAANAKLAATSVGDVGVASSFARAQQLEPNGCPLLDMREPFTIATLRNAYRAAAKRHHPDVGGDTALMQRINEIYALFFAALQQDAAAQADPGQVNGALAQSAADVMNDARRMIFVTAIDDLAADTALALLPTLSLPTSGSLLEPILRLAKLLSAMGKTEDAKTALALGEDEFARLTARGLNFAHVFAAAAATVAQPKRLRLVINHRRQADNAIRLGLINRASYDQTIKRLDHDIAEAAAQQATLVSALGAINFAQLPGDPDGLATPPAGLVAVPAYYARLDDLEPPQTEEYKQGFFGHDGALAAKYIFVRLDALLKAVIEGYDLVTATSEAQAIRNAAVPQSSLQYYAAEVCSLFEFFAQQGPDDLAERFALLRTLDKDGMGKSIPVGSTPFTIRIAVPKPILLSPSYLQFAREPLSELRNASA